MSSATRNLVLVISANLDQMRGAMKSAEAVIHTTENAMKQMANAYDGTKTIANANAAMIAVDKIGGVTKLTDAEQKRLNATLNEGLAKYQALGQQAPRDMLAMRDATKQADTSSSNWIGTLKSLAATI